jgi:UDP-N-acetylmuramoylalanine--D-glutamate ligase
MSDIDMDFVDKRVTIIGLSDSGFSAARLLKRLNAKVQVSEARDEDDVKNRLKMLKDVDFETGSHTKQFIAKSDIVVVSPGVPLDAMPIRWATECNIPIIGEMELGAMFCNAPIIAVTGTNGKSTTATLIHNILKENKITSFLRGNIGTPICEDVLDIPSDSLVVLEVSSFQLETIKSFRPKISVFLNLTQDHLDRYRDMNEYESAKIRIFVNQKNSDYAILNYDSPIIRGFSNKIRTKNFYFSTREKVKGAYLEDNKLFVDLGDGAIEVARREDINLPGEHNLENALAAILTVKIINRKAKLLPALKEFIGLKHRFQLVSEIDGVKFIDDSKSTTVHSTLRALESLPGNVVLIAGGKDKGSEYSLVTKQARQLKYLVLIGEARQKIKDAFYGLNIPIKEAKTMEEAVSIAKDNAREGDIVLLSPMCSSFDMFKDYKERGEVFTKAVLDELSLKYSGRY